MVERLRALLERPLDPALARAVVALACAVAVGFALVVALGDAASERSESSARSVARRAAVTPQAAAPIRPPARPRPGRPPDFHPSQDPQDRPGSDAARRTRRELATHRALQYVPYRHGGVAIDLVGARGARAVLAVRAQSLAAARRGWRSFLHRFDDDGRAYRPVFGTRGHPRD